MSRPFTNQVAVELAGEVGMGWEEVVALIMELLPMLIACAGGAAKAPGWIRGDGVWFMKKTRVAARQQLVMAEVRRRCADPAKADALARAVVRRIAAAPPLTMIGLAREHGEAQPRNLL
jgi:hypothetical protein